MAEAAATGSEWFVIMMDEKGSTVHDAQSSPADILSRRARLFGRAIGHLANALEVNPGPKIIKNVGDALLIKCKSDTLPKVLVGLLDLVDPTDAGGDDKDKKTPRVRVAVHGGDSLVGFDDDDALLAFLKEMRSACEDIIGPRETNQLDIFWPGNSTGLREDMFGPTINRAARLASVPDDPYLIISESVRNALHDLTPAAGRIEVSPDPIPLFSVRGVDEFSCVRPWLVYQVRRAARAPTETLADAPVFDLEREAARAQSWREVFVSFSNDPEEDERSLANKDILTRLGAFEPTGGAARTAAHYCVDSIYRTRGRWNWRPYPTDRRARNWVGEKKGHFEAAGVAEQPTFAITTSTLDQKHDLELRRYLSEACGTADSNDWDVTVQTHDIHDVAIWRNLQSASSWHALVKFVVDSQYLNVADNMQAFFQNGQIPYIQTNSGRWEWCSYGVLRGIVDGYILFGFSPAGSLPAQPALTIGNEFTETLTGKLERTVEASKHPDKTGIYGRIIPLTVDLLELEEAASRSPIRLRKRKVLLEARPK